MARTEESERDPAAGARSKASPTTLESFVSKLHADGVEAGRKEAERLIEEAKEQAETIIGAAEAEARRIVESAEADAKRETERVDAELRLAGRDALLQLRSTLDAALAVILRGAAAKELNNPAVVGDLLREAVAAYAGADAAGRSGMEIRVSRDLSDELADWGMKELGHALKDGGAVDLHATLADAGFEYRIGGSTVEVTPDAALEKLKELVSPRLRDLLNDTTKDVTAGHGTRGDRSPTPSGQD
ncbi:MAG: hypothetical protein P8Z36_02240 [Gemmatimonadota bacterium]|jgi:vacuolar-type H+-ATPase subunit H